MMRTYLYTGSTPVDLEAGDSRLSLVPGGVYEIDDKGKLALLKQLPDGLMRDITPQPVPKPARREPAPALAVIEPVIDRSDEHRPKGSGKGK